ncbi:MAG: hypothetical protein U5R31_12260 [Acidimicrobiia bacterium]|nr:hypothetical protein [Acidimicrobiia bacterium]
MFRYPRAPALAALLLALALAGCGGGEREESATTSAEVETSTTTAEPGTTSTTAEENGERKAILAAVEGYWQTIREASNPPDPGHPGFDQFFTGEARQQSLETMRGRQVLGHGVRLPTDSQYSHDLEVAEIAATHAVVTDCAVDDTVLFELETGEIVNDEVQTLSWRTELELVNGAWKVSVNTVEREWEGVAGCDL